MNENAQQWIDRYSIEVGRMLPAARREDIVREIRSLLSDELEDRSGDGVGTEADVLALLRQYPSPAEMAARYGAPQTLIGPALYPTYLKVARMVALIVGIVTVTALVVGLFTQGPARMTSVVGGLWSAVSSIFLAVAIVTLIFAVIERAATPDELVEIDRVHQRAWRPETLPPVARRDRVGTADMVGEIATTLIAILWLNLYVTPQGALSIFAGEALSIMVFSPLFVAFIPWLTLLWTGDLVTQIVVLARRRWERPSRVVAVALGVAESLLLGWMLGGGALAATPGLEQWVRGGVATVLLITLLQLAGHLWALIKQARYRTESGLPTAGPLV